MAPVPTHGDFMETSRSEFRFLLDDFGFHEAPCSLRQERFCVRFTKDDRSVEVRGEGWGTTAACHVFCGDKGPLSLIYLVPDAFLPKRSRKRIGWGSSITSANGHSSHANTPRTSSAATFRGLHVFGTFMNGTRPAE
jgi:hypothetical protein